MYFLIQRYLTNTRILQVCGTVDQKHALLDQELRKHLVKLVKHVDDMNCDGLYCVPSTVNINMYEIYQIEHVPAGYIYGAQVLKKVLYIVEWVHYKTDEQCIYKQLLNDEIKKYQAAIKPAENLVMLAINNIRKKHRRHLAMSPPPDVTAANYATSS